MSPREGTELSRVNEGDYIRKPREGTEEKEVLKFNTILRCNRFPKTFKECCSSVLFILYYDEPIVKVQLFSPPRKSKGLTIDFQEE